MSLPRRAMSDMGLAICCLMCDAPDDVGSARCKACITQHGKVRERLARGDDAVSRWGRELLAMMANPDQYDFDNVHGEVLQGYVRLLTEHEGPRVAPTQEEIDSLFAAARARPKGSLIRDMANRNPWKDSPPSVQSAREMSDKIDEIAESDVGQRTVPSREIEKVDRSDRPGEDTALTDRVSANVAVQDEPEELQDILADVHVAKRKSKRDKFSDAVEGLDDLLD
ncbi:MAG: hypothetical protein NZ802_10445 [Candidatus Poseidoniales archaeon]|nr:hypothetical protein [Candidatus Poseidoniales archaeon]